jgi:hypothetical protein
MSEIVDETPHSELGPSAAHRWMKCPGSVKLSRLVPNQSSEFAEEGTRAHELAEKILTNYNEEGSTFQVGEDVDMFDNVMEYVNTILGELNRCQLKQASKIELLIEKTITLEAIDNRLFGTVDAMFYCAAESTLYVFDLKYGAGVEVDVEENPQLMYYALAGWSTCFANTVKLTIVQPRVDNSRKSITYTALEMDKFADQLTKAIDHVDEDPERYIPGPKQCRWCNASAVCPAQARAFGAITNIEPKAVLGQDALPLPATLTNSQAGIIFANSPQLKKWLDDVSAHVRNLCLNGEDIQDAKIVEQSKNRVYKNPKDAEAAVRKAGHLVKDIMVSKLKSPAQLQKAGVTRKLIDSLTITPKGAMVVVPITDKRPAVKLQLPVMEPIEKEKS